MFWAVCILCLQTIHITLAMPTVIQENSITSNEATWNFTLYSRESWKARNATEKDSLNTPVPYVVIHHSYEPPACYDNEQCSRAMRSMQNYHMDGHKWWDIGYHFAVGSDGAAYEGRGWRTLGAHALHFNTVSIGICLIGDWQEELPPPQQLETTKALIAVGVEEGFIRPDYKLVGHRQVRDTICPGPALQQEIETWPHYSPLPHSAKDLKNVDELPDSVKQKL